MKTDRGLRLPLLPTLVSCITSLLLIAVGLVIYLQFHSGRRLIGDMGRQIVASDLSAMKLSFLRYISDSQQHAVSIARQVGQDASLLRDHERLQELLKGLFAAEPQLERVVLLDSSIAGFRVARTEPSGEAQVRWLSLADISVLHRRIVEAGDIANTPIMSAPQFDGGSGRTVTTLVRWLVVAGRAPLLVAISTAIEPLSGLALNASDGSNSMQFALLGDEKVLAHPLLANGPIGLSKDLPLPTIDDLGDGVLAQRKTAQPVDLIDISDMPGAWLGKIEWRGAVYLMVSLELRHTFGGEPVTVGAYRRADAVRAPLVHFRQALALALAVLAVALVGAVVLGHVIARPVKRVSRTAAKIGRVDFDDVEDIPGSLIAELNDLAASFNAMVKSLRLFGRYVPHSLVSRLISQGVGDVASEEREMTVLFTDIAGFTGLSEGMAAADVARFINHHLTLLGECVEGEGGTIDKYIGDALMAFWGAPEIMHDHAEAACRAAIAIAEAVGKDNRAGAAAGRTPVRVRVGIHTGPLVVGDIGSPNRINYTVIGDTVNAAARLESLGKTIDPKAEVIILISDAVKKQLPDGWATTALGRHSVHGRSEQIAVFRLDGRVAGADSGS